MQLITKALVAFQRFIAPLRAPCAIFEEHSVLIVRRLASRRFRFANISSRRSTGAGTPGKVLLQALR